MGFHKSTRMLLETLAKHDGAAAEADLGQVIEQMAQAQGIPATADGFWEYANNPPSGGLWNRQYQPTQFTVLDYLRSVSDRPTHELMHLTADIMRQIPQQPQQLGSDEEDEDSSSSDFGGVDDDDSGFFSFDW